MSFDIDFEELMDLSDDSDSPLPSPSAIKATLREQGKHTDGKMPHTTASTLGVESSVSVANIGALMTGSAIYRDADIGLTKQETLLSSLLGASTIHQDNKEQKLGGGFDLLIPESIAAEAQSGSISNADWSGIGSITSSGGGQDGSQGGSGAWTWDGIVGAGSETHGSAANSPISSRGYIWPVPYKSFGISSYYGPRWGRLHAGIDISVPVGTPMLAVKAGKVVHRWQGAVNTRGDGYGRYLELQYSDGSGTSRYGHLSSYSTPDGAVVPQGALIGTSGGAQGAVGSGNSQGPHLHFEIRPGGTPADPMPYLPPKP